MPFACCYEKVEYARALYHLIQSCSGHDFQEEYFSLIVVGRPFHLFSLIDLLDSWWRDGAFECRLHTHLHQ